MNIEDLARDQKLAEQAIIRQSLEDKDRRIWELEQKVELLEGMLNRAAALGNRFPVPQPMPAIKAAPRRWSVR